MGACLFQEQILEGDSKDGLLQIQMTVYSKMAYIYHSWIACKLVLALFKDKYFFEVLAYKNEVTGANLQPNKRILNCQSFRNNIKVMIYKLTNQPKTKNKQKDKNINQIRSKSKRKGNTCPVLCNTSQDQHLPFRLSVIQLKQQLNLSSY